MGDPQGSSKPPRAKTWWAAGVMWFVIVAVSAFVVVDFRAPGPASVDAPADEFSADRAWEDLVEITRAPHPAASLEGDRVRDHVATTLDDLGWDVRIAQATPDDGPRVSNVLGRLDGTCDTDDAVMLVTHYDSVPAGPGAGDVGSSVAALLEVARAIPEGEPLCNDVIILLTDGEESQLLGARAFVDEDPWADDVGFVVNFDARGGTGPLLLGEWSEPSPALVREVTSVVSGVSGASSLVNEGPERIDTHTTDFEVFHELDVPGVNGANVGDSVYYHTPRDVPEVVSRSTVQHNGEVALDLARHFGNEDLNALPDAENGVWIALTSEWLVAYGVGVAVLLALVVVALGTGVVFAARSRSVRWRRVFAGMLAFPVAGLAAFVFTTVLLALVTALHPDADIHLGGMLPHNADLPDPEAYWWAFVAAGAALSAGVVVVARRWLLTVELTLSGVLFLGGLGVLTTFVALPISYLFVLPALGSLVGALIWLRTLDTRLDGAGATATLAVSAVPALLVYVGFLRFSQSARLGLSALFVPVVALLFVLLVPQLEMAARIRRRLAPAALGAVALVLLVVAAVTTDADPLAVRPERVDDIRPATVIAPIPVGENVNQGEWRVDAVSTDDGTGCLVASVPDESLTGDVGWCPVPDPWAPVLDFQWGRTHATEWTRAPGARAAFYDPVVEEAADAADADDPNRAPDPTTTVVFGGVASDGPTVVEIVADGETFGVTPREDVLPDVAVWAIELPHGTTAVEQIRVVSDDGAEIASAPGFALVPEEDDE